VTLETRYRRLLAWYPAEHRARYADEMLGVLMDGSSPGQRYPRLRESLDLLTTATWRRLGQARAGFTDSRWADASAVLGVLATILLCGKAVRPISSALAYHIAFYGYAPYQVHWSLTLRAALWAGVTVAVLGGWRRIAAPAAWLVVCTDAVLLLARHPDQRLDPLTWWATMLEAIAAVLLTASSGPRRGLRLLARRGLVLAAVAAVVEALAPVIEPFLAQDWPPPPAPAPLPEFYFFASLRQTVVSGLALATYLAVAALIAWSINTIDPVVRRRAVIVAAPLAAALAIVQLSVDEGFSGLVYVLPPPLSGTAGWAALLTVPPFLAALGLLLLRRRERVGPSGVPPV